MGTNFYARHIPTAKEREQMEALLITSQWERLKEVLNESTKEYHIGKRSCGWQFLFHSSTKGAPWRDDTLQSIKDFLEKEDIEIINEYGDSFTPKQFWGEEIGYCLYNDPEKYINCIQYYKEHPKENVWGTFEFTTEEGLRFSKSEDFC